MADTAIGVALAVGASALTNAGIMLQAAEARQRPQDSEVVALTSLLRRPRWLVGTLLTAAAWPLQFAALLFAPLSVVQPTMAVGLVLVVFGGSRMLGERLHASDLMAALLLVAGIAVVGFAAPTQVTPHRIGASGVTALVLAAALSLTPQVIPKLRGRGIWPTLGAGLAYSWTAMASDLLAQSANGHHWLGAAGWAAGVGMAALYATATEMVALRSRPAGQVAPLLVAVETMVPVLLAPAVANESWRHTPLGGAVLVGGAIIVVLAGIKLSRAKAAQGVFGAEQASPSQAEAVTA